MIFAVSSPCAVYYRSSGKILQAPQPGMKVRISEKFKIIDQDNDELKNTHLRKTLLESIPQDRAADWELTTVKFWRFDRHGCGTGFYSGVVILTPLTLGLLPLYDGNQITGTLYLTNHKTGENRIANLDLSSGIGIGWLYVFRTATGVTDWYKDEEQPFKSSDEYFKKGIGQAVIDAL